VVAADCERARRIARALDEFGRRLFEDRTQESGGKANKLALDVGPGLAPEPQRRLVAAEFDPDLLQNRVGGRLDASEALLAEELVGRDFPREPAMMACARSAARCRRALTPRSRVAVEASPAIFTVLLA
jgi:hypothetical protein